MKNKAILEIKMPDSCFDCPLHVHDYYIDNEYCFITRAKTKGNHAFKRHKKCPLKKKL